MRLSRPFALLNANCILALTDCRLKLQFLCVALRVKPAQLLVQLDQRLPQLLIGIALLCSVLPGIPQVKGELLLGDLTRMLLRRYAQLFELNPVMPALSLDDAFLYLQPQGIGEQEAGLAFRAN